MSDSAMNPESGKVPMENTMSGTAPFTNNMGSQVDASMPAFDYQALIGSMKSETKWKNGGLNTKILVQSPDLKILLTILHEGTEITSFLENNSITFRIIEGKLKLRIHHNSITLSKGELLTINERTKYRFDSVEETAFLLTLAPSDMKWQE